MVYRPSTVCRTLLALLISPFINVDYVDTESRGIPGHIYMPPTYSHTYSHYHSRRNIHSWDHTSLSYIHLYSLGGTSQPDNDMPLSYDHMTLVHSHMSVDNAGHIFLLDKLLHICPQKILGDIYTAQSEDYTSPHLHNHIALGSMDHASLQGRSIHNFVRRSPPYKNSTPSPDHMALYFDSCRNVYNLARIGQQGKSCYS